MGMRPFHVEGDDCPFLPGAAEYPQRIDLRQPRHSVIAQIRLMRSDRFKADAFHIIKCSPEADRFDNGRSSRLEAMRWFGIGDGVARPLADHLTTTLIGGHVPQMLHLAVKHANARGPISLVAGEDIEI